VTLLSDRRGATLVEYLVVVGLVGLGGVTAYKVFGARVFGADEAQGRTVECVAMGGGSCGGAGGAIPSPPGGGADPGGGAGAGPGGECPGGACVPGTGNCFVAGTPIATPAGEVSIERLRAGDEVWTLRPETGEVLVRRVSATFATPERDIVDVRVRGSDAALRSTPEHPFLTLDRGWVVARDLAPGEPVVTADGAAVAVESLSAEGAREEVYNFEVEETHAYFVGEARVAVHNYCAPNSYNPGNYGAQPGDGSYRVGDNGAPDTYVPQGTFGPLRPGGERKFFPGHSDPNKQCITQAELQQLAQEDGLYSGQTAGPGQGYTSMDQAGLSRNDYGTTKASSSSACSTVICDSSNGMCFSGQAGKPFGPSSAGQGPQNPQVCAQMLDQALAQFPPPRPQNWDALNCAEKRALLQWMDYQRTHGGSLNPKDSGLFAYSVDPSQPGCPDKPACRNCQTHMPALGIYSVSDSKNTGKRGTASMNTGLPRPSGLCP
jgi:hypothetical protein